jgi:hypothetical protein
MNNTSTLTSDFFNLYVLNSTLCNLTNTLIQNGPDASIVNLTLASNSTVPCSQLATLNFALRENINQTGYGIPKTRPAIQINTPGNLDLLPQLNVELTMPTGQACPNFCVQQAEGTCNCPDKSGFNVVQQIHNLFIQSNFELLEDNFNVGIEIF